MQIPFLGTNRHPDVLTFSSQESEIFYRHLVELTPEAVVIHSKGKIIFANSTAIRLIGSNKPTDLIGQSIAHFIHPDDFPLIQRRIDRMIKTGKEAPLMEERFIKLDGQEIYAEVKAVPFSIDDGTAILAVIRDVTERKRAEDRQEFLSRVNLLLSSSLDYEETLRNISHLTVPNLADYFRLVVHKPDGEIQEVASRHIEIGKVKYVKLLYQYYKDRPDLHFGVSRILKTGKPEIIPNITEDNFKITRDDPRIASLVKRLKLKSYMGVPLVIRKQTIGVMTFSLSRPGRFYAGDDLILAQEFAARIALALENSRLYKEAKTAVTLRDNFISITSHELKTPITGLRIYTQMLYKKFRQDEGVKEVLQRMNHQMDSLVTLVNDLLNVSKIQLGKLEMKKGVFSLSPVIKNAADNIQTIHPGYSIIVADTFRGKVIGDKDRIGQVMTNLLTNAVKYSPNKKRIMIRMEKDHNLLIVSVKDFGIGIDKKYHQKIFELFYRALGSGEKTYPGLGVGLYISAQIIQRHGGKMWVKSRKGQGSTFFFSLPVAR